MTWRAIDYEITCSTHEPVLLTVEFEWVPDGKRDIDTEEINDRAQLVNGMMPLPQSSTFD